MFEKIKKAEGRGTAPFNRLDGSISDDSENSNSQSQFSERDTGKTDLELLAEAFEHMELSAKEKTLLDQYKQNIEKYNNIEKTLKAEQEKLRGWHST